MAALGSEDFSTDSSLLRAEDPAKLSAIRGGHIERVGDERAAAVI